MYHLLFLKTEQRIAPLDRELLVLLLDASWYRVISTTCSSAREENNHWRLNRNI